MTINLRDASQIHRSPLCSPSLPENVDRLVVLVVEDHDDTRAMLKILLQMYGCRVLLAEDGQAAIRLAESARPDLILMDMRLPLIDGLAAMRLIREGSWLPDVTILAVTGDASAKFQLETIAAGCNECLVKPIDFGRLERLVKALFAKKLNSGVFQPKYWLALRSGSALARQEPVKKEPQGNDRPCP